MLPKEPDESYEVALSFAGEDREIAERMAGQLMDHGVEVFYDELERADLWGKDLYQYLHRVYSDLARFCVVLVSEEYVGKSWPEHELKAIQARDFREDREYLLPVRLDDADLPGLSPTMGYVSLRKAGVNGIVNLLLEKLYGENYPNFYDAPHPDWEGETTEFRGSEVASFWPRKVEESQAYPSYVASRVVTRVPYGEENYDWDTDRPCHDCSVVEGEYHVPGCDVEECPLCGHQALSCDCRLQWTAEAPRRPLEDPD